MNPDVIIPAQVRAGRALIGWSQEQLATEATVGLGTVRDFESEKRAADTSAVSNIRRALSNGGVVFVTGNSDEGPGVRLIGARPSLVRRPTTLMKWDGLPFGVEWEGKHVAVFLADDALDDLAGTSGNITESAALATFEANRGLILDAVKVAFDDGSFDNMNRLIVKTHHVTAAKDGPWHAVTLNDEETIKSMMHKFATAFRKAGVPPRVDVFVQIRKDGTRTYYFSPIAVKVGKTVLVDAKSVQCKKAPDLDNLKKVLI